MEPEALSACNADALPSELSPAAFFFFASSIDSSALSLAACIERRSPRGMDRNGSTSRISRSSRHCLRRDAAATLLRRTSIGGGAAHTRVINARITGTASWSRIFVRSIVRSFVRSFWNRETMRVQVLAVSRNIYRKGTKRNSEESSDIETSRSHELLTSTRSSEAVEQEKRTRIDKQCDCLASVRREE